MQAIAVNENPILPRIFGETKTIFEKIRCC